MKRLWITVGALLLMTSAAMADKGIDVSDAVFEGLSHASCAAASVPLDMRSSYGGRLVSGMVAVGSPTGAAATAWDTTAAADGWQKVSSEGEETDVCVLNDDKVLIEEGRLQASVTWKSNEVHVIRHWVTVPADLTLTITEGTVVKFTEDAGIRVEDGGYLTIRGALSNDVRFVTATPGRQNARVDIAPYANFTENGYLATRQVDVSAFGTLSVDDAQCIELEGGVYIYVKVAGERDTPFSVDWRAVDGTAKYGTDYFATSGTVSWTSSADGVGYFQIPLQVDFDREPDEEFTIELDWVRGMNLARDVAKVKIVESAIWTAYRAMSERGADEAARLDQRTSLGGRIAAGTERVGTPDGSSVTVWNTAEAADARKTLTAGGASAEVIVRNGPGVRVEEGRLAADTIWDETVTHLVRNWVTVPTDLTLTIKTGTVVKFTEATGIRVENGGRLRILDEAGKVVFTMAEDDTIGGDTDLATAIARRQDVEVYLQDYGMLTENGNLEVRNLDVNVWGGIAVQPVRTLEMAGVAFVPVTVTGDRATAFSVDWVAERGTAEPDGDYQRESGTLTWTAASEGTKFIEIPLTVDTVHEPEEAFTVRLTAVRGMNIRTESAPVGIVDTDLIIKASDMSTSAASAPARLEQRTSFGGHLAHGIEKVGTADGSPAADWDTTKEANGLCELKDGEATFDALVVNDADVELNEGRLQTSVTWTADKVHLVRNWVVVPDGVTLTVKADAVVKFTEDTGIKVEDGGTLDVEDTAEAPVTFTVAEDDTIGGDTDHQEKTPAEQDVEICLMPSGTLTEHGHLETRYMAVSTFGSVDIQDVRAIEVVGAAYVPVTVTGDRKQAFSVVWRAVDGTAKFGEDYTLASGTLAWTGTGEGTKFIEIPLTADTAREPEETFTVELLYASGMNLGGKRVATVRVRDSELTMKGSDIASGTASPVRLEQRTSFGGHLAHGVEKVGTSDGGDETTWDTTKEENGLFELTDEDGGVTFDAVVQNGEGVVLNEGRLGVSETWSADKVHLVRNWVVVPNGMTLTILEGTIVKFTEDTGIRVEDGGTLSVGGSAENRVVFTMAEDDSAGGDTDLLERTPAEQDVLIDVMPSGTLVESGYLETRWMTVNAFGSADVSDAIAEGASGRVFLPVSVTGTRTKLFSVDWIATVEGDEIGRGTLSWSGTSEGTKFIELGFGDLPPGAERVDLRLFSACGMNLGRRAATITVFDAKTRLAADMKIDEGTSAPVRIDQRQSLGGRLVHGVEKVGAADGESVRTWNTTEKADGWQILTDGEQTVSVLVRNDETVAVEEGRLTTSATWTAEQVHLVRNWVTVPSGVTLTVEDGAVVKFTEDTGIRVEPGGALKTLGTADEHIVFTMAEDDVDGGDTDMRTVAPKAQGVEVQVLANATYSEAGWTETRQMDTTGFGSVSVIAAQAFEQKKVAYVPVTVDGTRTKPFAVYWRVVDGTARFGEDYTVTSGRLDWKSANEGTKFIEIPLVQDDVTEAPEAFTVELRGACGVNVAAAEASVMVLDNPMGSALAADGSGTTAVDVRPVEGPRQVAGAVDVAFGTWQEGAVSTKTVCLSIARTDGTEKSVLLAGDAPTNGVLTVDLPSLGRGLWRLTHEERDVEGNVLATLTADLNAVFPVKPVVVDGVMWFGEALSDGGFAVTGAVFTADNETGVLKFPESIDGLTVVEVRGSAFQGRTDIVSVEISSGVTNIGANAFNGCSSLRNLVISSAVKELSIGASAFQNCALVALNLPEGVVSIGPFAFCMQMDAAYNLTLKGELVLPASLRELGYYAFTTNSVERVEFKGDLPTPIAPEWMATISPEDVLSIGFGATIAYHSTYDASWADVVKRSSGWLTFERIDDSVLGDIVIPGVVTLPRAEVTAAMSRYPELAALAENDPEKFVRLPSAMGKLDAAGDQMQVWQDIVAGTDPTNVGDVFKIVDVRIVDGDVKVTWSPDLKTTRKYTEYGKRTLAGAETWTDMKGVSPEEKPDFRFRKVTVDFP